MEEWNMAKQYTQEFKEDAVRYCNEHKDLCLTTCAKNLGVSKSALAKWKDTAKEADGAVATRGRGNFESNEAKENAKLKKELRDTQDALAILKKAIGILGN